MTRIIKQSLLAAITLILSVIAHSENKIITVSTGEWPPFISENLKYHGVAARIISESFALQGIQVRYGWFPWKRSYDNVSNGSWDASAIWAVTSQRRKDVLFSDPIIENKTVLFFRKSSLIAWESYDDLTGLVIGATDGYFNGDEFAQAEKKGLITVERTNTESSNFKKLAANRLDAVIAEIDAGYEIMRRTLTVEQIDSIVVSPKNMASFSNHLIISKKIEDAEALISAFNIGLKKLTESGKVNQYLMESRNGQYHQ
jgi:polar amino acid transport system substrate-binding protein